MILIGAPAGLNFWIPPMLRLLGIKGLNRLLLKTIARPSISGMKNIYRQLLIEDHTKLSEDYYEHCIHGQKLPGTITAHRTMLENVLTHRGWKKEYYIGDQLGNLRVPVGFIWGDNDAFESPETGMTKAKQVEKHTFEVVKNAGHCPWFDQPEKCVSLILELLNK